MPDTPRMIYWDSSVFLHYIEGSPEWLPTLDAVIQNATQDERLAIVTSTVAITEVAFAKAEKSGRVIDPGVEAEIDALWNDRSAVQLVEFDQGIAREARRLVRRSVELARALRPMDAIHLATAVAMGVEDFHTTDGRLRRWTDLGFPVRAPWTSQPRLPLT